MTNKECLEYIENCLDDDFNYKNATREKDKLSHSIILNLIKKQSKEIEELKKYEEGYKLLSYSLDNYTSNDKIKAKIEEYENKIKKIRSKKLINEPEDTIVITRYAHYISVLQSLLEKE